MQKVKRKKKIRLSSLLLRLGSVALGLYLVVTLVYAQVEISTQRAALANVTQQVTAQQAATQELARVLQGSDESSYMENIARERLGYALPDERIFIDMSGN